MSRARLPNSRKIENSQQAAMQHAILSEHLTPVRSIAGMQTWLRDVSESSLVSAGHFHDVKAPYNKYLKAMQACNSSSEGAQLSRKAMRIIRSKRDQGQNEYLKKDFDAFSTEYRDQILKGQEKITIQNRMSMAEKLASIPNQAIPEEDQSTLLHIDEALDAKQLQDQAMNIQNQNGIDYYGTPLDGVTPRQATNQLPTAAANLQDSADLVKIGITDATPSSVAAQGNPPIALTSQVLERFMQDNEDYFKHLRGECLCFTDECGLCKCKFQNVRLRPDLPQDKRSQYRKEHSLKKPIEHEVINTVNLHASAKYVGPSMDKESVMRQDFKAHDLSPRMPKPARLEPVPHYPGRSHYDREYLYWGTVPYERINQGHQQTTHKMLPFYKATTYKQEFIQKQAEVQKPTLDNWKTSFVQSPVPFLSQTTTNKFYRSYNSTERFPKVLAKMTETDEGNQAGSFKGMFVTSNKRDFQNGDIECVGYQDKYRGVYKRSKYTQLPASSAAALAE